MNGSTIFITGGGSGIGRGLAEAFHKLGNQVIISGRRAAVLAEVTAANPGMASVELNVEDPASIAEVARQLVADYPKLNVLLNNAGIMKVDDVGNPVDDAMVTSIVTTNLLGPIRMTSALIEHLKAQPSAAIAYVTSGLAFTPLSQTATYCATKAAIHSFALSQRYLLQGTNVRVLEIAPPYVQTELMGAQQKSDPRAMPLEEYIAETMTLLATGADEILVERVKPLRNNAGPKEHAFVKQFNEMMTGHHR
jgi:uncharacterized oxidoreductase